MDNVTKLKFSSNVHLTSINIYKFYQYYHASVQCKSLYFQAQALNLSYTTC